MNPNFPEDIHIPLVSTSMGLVEPTVLVVRDWKMDRPNDKKVLYLSQHALLLMYVLYIIDCMY